MTPAPEDMEECATHRKRCNDRLFLASWSAPIRAFIVGGMQPRTLTQRIATDAAQILACERAVEKFEPVLTPEDLTRRKHVAWRTEDAALDGLSGQLVVHPIKLGIART